MSASNVLLHELNISFPPVEKLPKPTGNWHIAKLVQYPAKTPSTTDSNGRLVAGDVIPGQFKCAEYSTFFQNTVTMFGRVIQSRSWKFGNNSSDDQTYVTLPLDSFSEDELRKIINDGHLYIYVQVEKLPGGRPTISNQATIDEYRAMTESVPPQQPVAPQTTNQTPSPQPTAN